jgi:aminoglycoside phosphotransferase family enzyme
LNKRLTSIYLNVIPIYKNGKDISLNNGSGTVIDYAVMMERMEAEKRMDVVFESGIIDKKQIENLALKISNFHKKATIIDQEEDKFFIDKRFRDIEVVLDWVESELGKDKLDVLTQSITFHKEFISNNMAWLNDRVKRKYKREVHGDLHSQNIYLLDDPVVFDCIEFSTKYSHIDVINEVSFICMDMEFLGRKDLSDYFLQCYLQSFPCIENKKDDLLFKYYKLYRANVKVKVNGLRGMQESDLHRKNEKLKQIERYINLMKDYLNEFSN